MFIIVFSTFYIISIDESVDSVHGTWTGGQQNGRRRRIHWAMATPHNVDLLVGINKSPIQLSLQYSFNCINCPIWSKNSCSYFLANVSEIWAYFYSNIWSHCQTSVLLCFITFQTWTRNDNSFMDSWAVHIEHKNDPLQRFISTLYDRKNCLSVITSFGWRQQT